MINKELNRGNPLHVRYLLNMSDDYVKEAMVEIYNQQSSFEKRHAVTVHANSRGFRVNHAKSGTEFALMVLNNEDFSFQDMLAAREMIVHYVNQLVEIYKEKEYVKSMKEKRKSYVDVAGLNLNFNETVLRGSFFCSLNG